MSELIYVIVILYAWLNFSLNDAAFIVLSTISTLTKVRKAALMKTSGRQGEAHTDFPESVDINVN